MDTLLPQAELAIVGTVTHKSEAMEQAYPDENRLTHYYDATVDVEQILSGPAHNQVIIRVLYAIGPSENRMMQLKTPPLSTGTSALFLLNRDTQQVELPSDAHYVQLGAGLAWGTYYMRNQDQVSPYAPSSDSKPLSEVIAWVEQARND